MKIRNQNKGESLYWMHHKRIYTIANKHMRTLQGQFSLWKCKL